jgi:hypothetical protein
MTPPGVSAAAAPGKASLGCMILFGLPFALGGLSALFGSLRAFQEGRELTEVIMLAVFGLVFGGVGAVVMYLGVRGHTAANRLQQLRDRAPGKPWLWREEWATGRITDGGKVAAGFFGLFAFVWNIFTVPMAGLVLSQNDYREEPAVLLVLLFPAAGILLLGMAIYAALQQRKFGQSVFVMASNPGVIGRYLRGTIETRLKEPPPEGAALSLVCINRVTSGSGKNRSTTERVKWQDSIELEPAALTAGMEGLTIPVKFEIPPDLPRTDDSNSDNQILWRLHVSAELPGIDFSANFEVPVYDTGEAPLTESEREQARYRRRIRARGYTPKDPRVRIRRTERGGMEFRVGPKPKVGSTIGGLLFVAAGWGVVWALLHFGAHFAFALFASFFAVLFTAALVISLLLVSTVTVERPVVTVRHRILGLGPTRVLDAGTISDVVGEPVSSQGAKASSWDVKIKTGDGRSYNAASLIPEQREAEWTAEQIRLAIRPM